VGSALGLAFQLVDDILDLAGDPNVTGKDLCADLREGKLTWPLIVAAEKDPWVLAMAQAYANGNAPAPDAEPLITRLQNLGAIEDTRKFAKRQADTALAELRQLPVSQARTTLELVVHACIDRSQ